MYRKESFVPFGDICLNLERKNGVGIIPTGTLNKMANISKTVHLVIHFYRAMHFSAKRGIPIACRLSVRPSVCLSLCLSVCL